MAEYILKGKILPFNIKSSCGGRVYTKESVEKAFNEFNKNVSEGRMFGCLESRHFPSVEATGNLCEECISHRVKSAELTDEGISVDIEVLDTEEGNLVKHLMDHDIALWGSITGSGDQRLDGTLDLYSISSVNLTCCPSFNPDEYLPLIPDSASSDILKKELEDQARRETVGEQLKNADKNE